MKYNYHRLIQNAYSARDRVGSDWGKRYWTKVIYQLTKNMREQETVH